VSKMPITDFNQELLIKGFLVDVRTPEEFGAGIWRMPKMLIGMSLILWNIFSAVDKDKTIYVYCKMGGRSLKAQEKLKSMGYKHVVNLEGAMMRFKNGN